MSWEKVRSALVSLLAVGGATAAGTFVILTTVGLEESEGLRTEAYLDPVGIPTVCFGETRGVRMGDTYTAEECREMLRVRIEEFDRELSRCIPDDLSDETRSALVQWAYNVGIGAACNSTLVRKLNAGDYRGACMELDRWVYGNFNGQSRVISGLVTRRAHERELCLRGLEQ